MRKLRIVALLALVALFLLPAVALAQPPVCNFYGTVTADGVDVDETVTIIAYIGGAVAGEATVAEYASTGLRIEQPAGAVYEAQAVYFYVGDFPAAEAGTWNSGFNNPLSLTFPGMPATGDVGTPFIWMALALAGAMAVIAGVMVLRKVRA